jgi:AraC-like DNA-binding protein
MSALCTARLLSPFKRLLAARAASPDLLPSELRSASAADRVPVELLHDTLERAVEHFGDEQLGLEFGSSTCLGELGPLDYLLRSAPTVSDAVQAAGRYSALQSDGYRVRFERWRGGGLIRLLDESSWPRPAGDMAISAAYRLHVAPRVPFTSRLECWFPYRAPADPSAYQHCFRGATLRFDAPFYAFAFDESYELAPQPAADASLHSLLRERLDALMHELGQASMLRPRVRVIVARQINQQRAASALAVARELRMSRRTLSRKLEQEGTAFADELDAVRRELALAHVADSERTFAEIEHAVSDPEYPDPSYSVGFAVDSGAYLVESNLGSMGFLPTADPAITLWRASAAVAEHSRLLANAYYPDFGPHRPYGYAWGGSGGAFKTIACIESMDGVWNGVVPFIHASPVALPNNFTVQAHALRLLRDDLPAIVDAVEPGGSGDPYAGLDGEERAALEEVTKFGFPPDAWFNYQAISFGYTGVLASLLPAVQLLDASYFDDFWTMPGYLGADAPESLEPYRVQHETTVARVLLPEEVEAMDLPLSLSAGQPANAHVPAAFVMADLPDGDLQGASITVESGAAAGTVVTIAGVFDDVLAIGYGQGFEALPGIEPGDRVAIDNSVYLAVQSYHRHQTAPAEYQVYDQYRDESGKPLYPQRTVQTISLFNQAGMMSGKFQGKMIVVENLMDEIAFPWHADWYRSKVQAALGARFSDNYRLWYVERAMHTPPRGTSTSLHPALTTRAVNYGPVLQQALRDVARWVEAERPRRRARRTRSWTAKYACPRRPPSARACSR